MKSAKVFATLFLATGLVAQTSTPPKPKRTRPAPVTAADVQALRDAIEAQKEALALQQQQLKELRDELHSRDQAVQQAQSSAADAASKADAAQAAATQQQQSVVALKGDVTDLKGTVASTVVSVQDAQKTFSASPTALHYKGVTITPGGFLAAEFVGRSRALGADINTPFNSITMPGASQARLTEFFGSGRQSRVSMLVEGRLSAAKLTGYVEADFLSAGITSNNNQSNSYTLRQRQAWGQAALDSGFSITGGQMWSLVTETKHGVDNRSEALPMTIDPQYTVGFSWTRQYGLRIAQNFGNKAWFAVSIENPQATVTSHGNASNFLIGSAGNGGGLYNSAITNCSTTTNSTTGVVSTVCSPAATYAFNPSPDVIAKLVFEPGFGHYELFGVYSRFRDRIYPCEDISSTALCGTSTTPGLVSAYGAYNSAKNGGGMGANARWSFLHKQVDFGLHGFGGSGVGRYGTGGLADTSINSNGTFHLIRSLQGLSTLEFHGRKLDVYLNAGAEYAARAASFDPVIGKNVGYGATTFNNSGCYSETGPVVGGNGFIPGSLSSCTADTRVLIEGTAGFWWRVYDGSKEKVNRGRIQWGPQFSYVTRNAWSGSGTPNDPHGVEPMVFTSFRYYIP